MKLSKLRKDIDRIDGKILEFLNKRTELILRIGKLKKKRGMPLYVPNREKEIIRKLLRKNKGSLPAKSIRTIYKKIISAALNLEKKI